MARTKQPLKVYMGSIVRRWIIEASGVNAGLVVVSPYLTSRTADRILTRPEGWDGNGPVVLTTFSAEVFAMGASHLPTLRRLLNGGCTLYHVDQIHAKIVLTQDFASIGSQNLTQGGTRNREATIAITDMRAIAEVREGVERWLSVARPIDIEMIDIMEKHLKLLRKRTSQLRKEISAVDLRINEELESRERERKEANRRRQEDKARREEAERVRRLLLPALYTRSSSLRDAISHTHPSNYMNVTVKDVQWEDSLGFNSGVYNTMQLSNPAVNDMRHWVIDGKTIRLEKKDPLLIFLPRTGRMALVLLKKMQTADFGARGWFRVPLSALGFDWYIGIEFAEKLDDLKSWNVKFTLARTRQALDDTDGQRIETFCYFDLRGISVERVERTGSAGALPLMEEGLRREDPTVKKELRRYLLDARRLDWHLRVRRPEAFFEGLGFRFRLQLHKLDTSLFLTATQV